MIRSLPPDEAVRVVDTYFPGWRESFLGVREPAPWLRTDDPLNAISTGGVYSHRWTFVGRQHELDTVLQSVRRNQPLVCVVGRGGIGKTKLIREIGRELEREGRSVRFVSRGAEVRPGDFELLPADGTLTVIVDDAHERDDLAAIVHHVRARNPTASVLLGLRPYGLDLLANDFRQLGVHPTEIPTIVLEDLRADAAEALALEALGDAGTPAFARRLAAVTKDCPLVTVVAGVLIDRGQLDPSCLDHEETIRTEVLTAFQDVLVANPLARDPELRADVLDGISALQPFRSDDPEFQTALAELVGRPYDRLTFHIRSLEDAGVLLRRGASLRIVPDLLGDVVLARACFDDRSGTPTGYLERAASANGTGPAQNVFVNASRVDWQVRHDSRTVPLTDSLWADVQQEFEAGGILKRRAVLGFIRKVAHFAPDPTLSIVRSAIEHPTETVGEVDDLRAAFLELHPLTYADVLNQIPPLLRGVGYHLRHVGEVLDILWRLANTDHRPPNQYPDHAMRVLAELAALEPGKPLAFNNAVVDAAQRWLTTSGATSLLRSPFEVLEPMLATEGTDHRLRGHTIEFTPYTLTPASVAPVRRRVIDLLITSMESEDLRTAVHAADTVSHALRYPHGYFGRQVDEVERDQWTPGFEETLNRLTNLVATASLDPVVLIAIRRAVRWHARHPRSGVRHAAEQLVQALPTSPAYDLTLALFDGWGHLTGEAERDFATAEATRSAACTALAEQLTTACTDNELADLIEERLDAIAALGPTSAPGRLVWALVEARPDFGAHLIHATINHPGSSLRTVLATALAALAENHPSSASAAMAALLNDDDIELRRQVGQSLGWNRGPRRTILDGELDALEGLATDDDESCRMHAVRAAQRLAPHHPDEALHLLCCVRFADSDLVADELFQSFGPHSGLDWRQLNDANRARLLDQLGDCPSIERYWITEFLADFSGEYPDDFVHLLQRRAEKWEASNDGGYRALPFSWDHDLKICNHQRTRTLLKEILDWIAVNPDSWQRRDSGGELFAAIARGYDAPVTDLLEATARTGSAEQLSAVAAVLREAGPNFALDNVDFVRTVLHLAQHVGEDALQEVGGALSAAAVSGTRTGVPGHPFSEDVHLRDRAKEIANSLPPGSPEHRLYRSLQRSAEQSIEWSREQDGLMRDGRDW